MTDDNLLRDARDLTQRLNFNSSQDDYTSPIIQSTRPELDKILSRLRQLTNSNLQGGQLRHGGQQPLAGQPQSRQQPQSGQPLHGQQQQSGQQPPSPAHNIYPPPEAGCAIEAPAIGSGGASPAEPQEAGGTLEVTPGVTRSAATAAGELSSLVTERTLHELQRLNLYTGAHLPDMAQSRVCSPSRSTPTPPRTRNYKRVRRGRRKRKLFRKLLTKQNSCRRLLSGRPRKTRG